MQMRRWCARKSQDANGNDATQDLTMVEMWKAVSIQTKRHIWRNVLVLSALSKIPKPLMMNDFRQVDRSASGL